MPKVPVMVRFGKEYDFMDLDVELLASNLIAEVDLANSKGQHPTEKEIFINHHPDGTSSVSEGCRTYIAQAIKITALDQIALDAKL